jgi:hypothetical protein
MVVMVADGLATDATSSSCSAQSLAIGRVFGARLTGDSVSLAGVDGAILTASLGLEPGDGLRRADPTGLPALTGLASLE